MICPLRSRHGLIVISNRNRLQSITLFHVIVIVIDYIDKNLDVIVIEYIEKNLNVTDYMELHFSASIAFVRSYVRRVFKPDRCRLSDKRFENLMFIKCNKHFKC